MRKKIFAVNYDGSIPFDVKRIDRWLSEIWKIDLPAGCPDGNSMDALAERVLVFMNPLFQSVNIPLFRAGTIVSVTQDTQCPQAYQIRLAVDFLDSFSDDVYKVLIHNAFRFINWMMQDEPSFDIVMQMFARFEQLSKELGKQIPGGKSTIPILRAAYNGGIPFIPLGAGIYQLGWGAKSRKLMRSASECDSVLGSQLVQNKVITANVLRKAGFPAPIHSAVKNMEDAIRTAQQIGFPVVVKPSDLDRGEGVTVNILSETQLTEAFHHAQKISRSKEILVEKHIDGVCHRMVFVGSQMVYCVKRNPQSIIGDGVKSILELIDQANREEALTPPWSTKTYYHKDDLALKTVQTYDYDFQSIPRCGERISLRPIETTAWGISPEDVTVNVHPDNVEMAQRMAGLFGLEVIGVDVMTQDIAIPWYENGAIVNEVNFAPVLGSSGISTEKLPEYLHLLLKGNGRIPVEIYLGCTPESESVTQRQQEWTKAGVRCYVTSGSKTYLPIQKEMKLAYQGLYQRCENLLMHKEVDALIVAIDTDEPLYNGLPFDRIDALHIDQTGMMVDQGDSMDRSAKATDQIIRYLESLKRS